VNTEDLPPNTSTPAHPQPEERNVQEHITTPPEERAEWERLA
jgi:hypothetical protein